MSNPSISLPAILATTLRRTWAFALVVGVLHVAAVSEARAGFEACGNIDVEAEAKCEVLVEAACIAKCEPVSFQAACAVELQASCSGQCEGTVEVSCTENCSPVCFQSCEVDPGKFDCNAECKLDCNGDCGAYCEANPGNANCEASCKAECAAQCDASCDVVLPQASCEEKCSMCCGATCEANANFSCQVECQAKGQAGCEAELSGGCKVSCEKPEGALFCDGQFVDHGGKLQDCIDALNAYLKSHVQVHASGDASCDGNSCMAEGEAGIACNCNQSNDNPFGLVAFFGAMTLGAVSLRRRKKS